MTRLIDVAARAGVSKSTVSNVIRGGALVAEETRRRVERAVAETGYRPNIVARSLRARASRVIGIVLPDLTNPFFAQLAIGVERAAAASGYAVLTAQTECAPAMESAAAFAFLDRRVDGVVIAGLALDSPLPVLLLDRDVPAVLVALGEIDDPRPGVIDHDTAAAMEAVVDHLCDLGHRHIGFLSHGLREHAGESRRLSVTAALARRGLALTIADAANVAARIGAGVTALVAHDDMQAIAAMDRLERAGLRVPRGVSVVGFDDVPLAGHHRIQLTTVRADGAALGRRAGEMVIGAAQRGRHVAQRDVIAAPLILRGSTAEAKVSSQASDPHR